MNLKLLAYLSLIFFITSCDVNPKPIRIGKDACDFCKMGVMDKRFGAEMITKKGKIYKFDDLHCLLKFVKEDLIKKADIGKMYMVEFKEPHGFIELNKAFLFKSESFRSPMGSDIAAFLTEQQLKSTTGNLKGEPVKLDSLMADNK